MPMPIINEVRVHDDCVKVKKGVFTVTIKPVDDMTLDDCIARGHQLMHEAGIQSFETKDMRSSVASN